MKQLHHLIQGTPEWHEYRNTRCGASDYAAISSGKALAIIKDKVFPKADSGNAYSAWGHFREPIIREALGDHLGIHSGAVVIESAFNPRIYASFDGFDDLKKHQVEIKTCKYTGQKLNDKFQEWTHQKAQQHYVIDDSTYEIYLAVERYETRKIEDKNGRIMEVPDKAVELDVYRCALQETDSDNARMFFRKIAQFKIDVNGEYIPVKHELMTDIEVKYFNTKSKSAWQKTCTDFLFQLDNTISQNNVDNPDDANSAFNDKLIAYKEAKANMDKFKKIADELKDEIVTEMGNKMLNTYKSPDNISVSITYSKKPMTQEYIASKIDTTTLSQEYFVSMLNIEKVVKDFQIEPEGQTQKVSIK